MYLMQIFVPAAEPQSDGYPQQHYAGLKEELADLFGGVTIYARAPVKGVWKPGDNHAETDNMIIYEVMLSHFDGAYWSALKSRLEADFRQQEILMRYFSISVVQ